MNELNKLNLKGGKRCGKNWPCFDACKESMNSFKLIKLMLGVGMWKVVNCFVLFLFRLSFVECSWIEFGSINKSTFTIKIECSAISEIPIEKMAYYFGLENTTCFSKSTCSKRLWSISSIFYEFWVLFVVARASKSSFDVKMRLIAFIQRLFYKRKEVGLLLKSYKFYSKLLKYEMIETKWYGIICFY